MALPFFILVYLTFANRALSGLEQNSTIRYVVARVSPENLLDLGRVPTQYRPQLVLPN
jgi:hypothetical protein